jgi:uncharacterized delta-60 repeat protein
VHAVRALMIVACFLALLGCPPANEPVATVPAAPDGLTAGAVSSSRIDLAWTDGSDDEDGFVVERSANGKSVWKVRAKTSEGVVEYQDLELASATTYYYRVSAYNGAGSSDPTDVASAATLASGSLDQAFGTAGKTTASMGLNNAFPSAMTLQSDGKILVAGSGFPISGTKCFCVERFGTDGKLDTSFGSAGQRIDAFFDSGPDIARAVALQSDGKIVLAGQVLNAGNYGIGLARYTTAGALDSTFGTSGRAMVTPSGSSPSPYAVAVQPDDKIVVAGSWQGGTACILMRFNADGSVDTTFGASGQVVETIAGCTDQAFQALALQGNGSIVVAGYAQKSAADYECVLARYTSSGAPDTAFGTSGIRVGDFTAADDIARAVAIQTDGRIVAAGFSGTMPGDPSTAFVARYAGSGALDTGFGTGGVASTPIGSGTKSSFFSVAVQTDKKIVAAGSASNGTDTDFTLARYKADGSLDTGFGTGGTVMTGFGNGDDAAYGVAILDDGLIVSAGIARSSLYNAVGLARYVP